MPARSCGARGHASGVFVTVRAPISNIACGVFSAVERPLPSSAEVFPIMEEWATFGKAKFVFMVKLFTESLMSSDDPKVIYMQFIQVRVRVCLSVVSAVQSASLSILPGSQAPMRSAAIFSGGVQHHHGHVPLL